MQTRKKHQKKFKKTFGILIKKILLTYELNYSDFCEKYGYSESSFRYWETGRNLPQKETFEDLKKFLSTNINQKYFADSTVKTIIENELSKSGLLFCYQENAEIFSKTSDYINDVLTFVYNVSKNKIPVTYKPCVEYSPTGKTRVVVFDFDGTLTAPKTNKTTWENLWKCLGYDIKECQKLHLRFNHKEITHEEWCKITEEKFKAKALNINTLIGLAKKIKLIKGVRKTFKELKKHNIGIYIVSGSILTIIQIVLGSLTQYVDLISANKFMFNNDGLLTGIIGTKYDFEGKAKFIQEISDELKISTEDIWFIGNSQNDESACISGAKTLCVNPKLTNGYDESIWNHCIQDCDNLCDILQYIL